MRIICEPEESENELRHLEKAFGVSQRDSPEKNVELCITCLPCIHSNWSHWQTFREGEGEDSVQALEENSTKSRLSQGQDR